MAISWSFVMVCLFLLSPLNLTASERVPENGTIPASAGETQGNPSQEKELGPTYVEQESAVTAHYASSPVATKAIDRNISLFTERIKERFSLYLQRSGKYLAL